MHKLHADDVREKTRFEQFQARKAQSNPEDFKEATVETYRVCFYLLGSFLEVVLCILFC